MLAVKRTITPSFALARKVQALSIRQASDSFCAPPGTISESYEFGPPEQPSNSTVGKWPRTAEERRLAAKKYNLIPEDYETFDEEDGYGDYPKLKNIGEYNRDKYDDFDDMCDYRFHGEPINKDADFFRWEKFDPLTDEKPSPLPRWSVRYAIVIGTPLLLWGLVSGGQGLNIHQNPPYKVYTVYPDTVRYSFPKSPNDGLEPHTSHHH